MKGQYVKSVTFPQKPMGILYRGGDTVTVATSGGVFAYWVPFHESLGATLGSPAQWIDTANGYILGMTNFNVELDGFKQGGAAIASPHLDGIQSGSSAMALDVVGHQFVRALKRDTGSSIIFNVGLVMDWEEWSLDIPNVDGVWGAYGAADGTFYISVRNTYASLKPYYSSIYSIDLTSKTYALVYEDQEHRNDLDGSLLQGARGMGEGFDQILWVAESQRKAVVGIHRGTKERMYYFTDSHFSDDGLWDVKFYLSHTPIQP